MRVTNGASTGSRTPCVGARVVPEERDLREGRRTRSGPVAGGLHRTWRRLSCLGRRRQQGVGYGMGLGAVTLRTRALPGGRGSSRQMQLGTTSGILGNGSQCAEALLGITRGAEMVKFTKDGSTATCAAIRLARTHGTRPRRPVHRPPVLLL